MQFGGCGLFRLHALGAAVPQYTVRVTLGLKVLTVVPNIPKFGAPVPADATSTITVYELSVQKEVFQHTHTKYVASKELIRNIK